MAFCCLLAGRVGFRQRLLEVLAGCRFLSAQRLEFCLALSGLLCRVEFGRSRVLPGALQCVLGPGQLRFERIPRGRDFRYRCAKFPLRAA